MIDRSLLRLVDATPIEGSSQIKALGYDTERSILYVEFHAREPGSPNGTFYAYQGVPDHVVSQVMNAVSVGTAFNTKVKKGGYEWLRLDDSPWIDGSSMAAMRVSVSDALLVWKDQVQVNPDASSFAW